jgi:adenine-specific DNA methylase
MVTNRNLTFIESPNFYIELVNEASAKEKCGKGRPPLVD